MLLKQFGILVEGEGLAQNARLLYEARVTGFLKTLAGKIVPQAIFHRIRAFANPVSGYAVAVRPWETSPDYGKPGWGTCNASGGGHKTFLHIGNGEIRFSIDTYVTGVGCSTGPGTLPQDILVHELVHSARFIGGDRDEAELPKSMSKYTDAEEFYAILLTNIYMSETGRTVLRRDHNQFHPLPANMDTSREFLYSQENLKFVKAFCKQHPQIAPMIAKADVPFNPIKLYLEVGDSPPIEMDANEEVGSHRQTAQVEGPPIVLSGDTLFGFGLHDLKPAAISSLQYAGMQIKQHPGKHILVQGFADSIGSDSSNMKLSEKRALAVKNWLVSKGFVSNSNVTAKGYGEEYAVASNKTSAGRAKNRRVEILVLSNPPR